MNTSKEVNSSISNIYALTPLQEGMLFHSIAENGGTSYVVQSVYKINGEFEERLVEKAISLLSKRYDVLRTAIIYEGLTKPKQIVLKNREIEYEQIDFRDYERTYALQTFDRIKKADVNRGFDLQKDSLLRVKLVIMGEQEYRMIWCFHHIIMDGWCLSLVYGEFLKYYDLLKAGYYYEELEKHVLSNKDQSTEYNEYIKWLNKKDRQEGLNYWKNLLEGYEENTKIRSFADYDDNRNPMERIGISFDNETKDRIYEIAAECKVTFNTIVEAAWGIVLQRFCNTKDIVFGKVVSGRDNNITGIEQIVGLFINTVPLRVTVDDDMSVEKLLHRLFDQSNKSSDYDYCSLSDIQNQSKLGPELIQYIFAFENYYADEEAIKCDDKEYSMEVEAVREETNYGISASANLEEGIFSFFLMYNPSEYSEKEIRNMLNKLKKTIQMLIQDKSAKISELDCIPDEEKRTILEQFNQPLELDVSFKNIIEYFEETVRSNPNKIAIVDEKEEITYYEFNRKVNQLALKLIEYGVHSNDFVAIIAERSIEMMIAIYGIIKAGGAYVPISPTFSENRINYILDDCKPKVVITFEYSLNSETPIMNLKDEQLWNGDAKNIDIIRNETDLVYCIYTSGTTGKPKGVMIEHKSLSNLCINIENILYKGCLNTNTALIAPYVFDASVKIIFSAIIFGHQLHIISDDLKNQVSELMKYATEKQIAIMDGTPTYFKLLSKERNESNCLKRLIIGGEALTNSLVDSLTKINMNLEVINVYGPTEATVDATFYRCNRDTRHINIGKPINNVNVYIVDKDNHLCGIGEAGEICIAGVSVARGYLNQEDLTSEKFTRNVFGQGRMYHTGDIGFWRMDGNIECVGRVDEQVKIRGFRIELGEIENVILEMENIQETAVVINEDDKNEKIICAYVVSKNQVDLSELREELLKELPSYMIPTYIMQIDELPLTHNGKLNKEELPQITRQKQNECIAPKNEVQRDMVSVFEKILGIEGISITDTFFELGGDSIKAIRVVSKIREVGYQVTVKDIIKKQTVEAISTCAVRVDEIKQDEREVSGVVVTTPIIQSFIDRNLVKPEHFNHSIMIQVNAYDKEVIKKGLDAIYEHHDILRSVFRNQQLEILQLLKCKKYEFKVCDYKNKTDVYKKIQDSCNELQESMNFEEGPLMKTAYFITDHGNYLMICLHHLVVDGVSWRILLEDLETAMELAEERKVITLPKKTDSYSSWSQVLQEYKTSQKFKYEYDYWKQVIVQMQAIIPFYNISNESKQYAEKEISLGREETHQLFYEAPKSFGTEANDLLLCALSLTVKQIFSTNQFIVELEGHGREEIHKSINIDRTVGWFTSKYPVLLVVFDDLQKMIIKTKEMLRAVPNHGMGYGLLKDEFKKINSIIKFNYLGMTEKEEEVCPFSTGCDVAVENTIDGLITLNSIVENGKLSLSVVYDRGNIQEHVIDDFLQVYLRSIDNLVKFCLGQKESIVTASDCSQTDLSMEDFSSITEFMSMDLGF